MYVSYKAITVIGVNTFQANSVGILSLSNKKAIGAKRASTER